MNLKSISRTLLLLLTLVIVMVFTINFTKTTFAADTGSKWKAFNFKSGQMFSYDFKKVDKGMERTGEVTIWIDEDMNDIEMIIEGEFDNSSFSAFATSEKGDLEEIFVNFSTTLYTELPSDIRDLFFYTIWSFAMEPLYNKELAVGWEYQDEYDVLFRITGKKTYAGMEGYLVQMEDEDEFSLEFCIYPELPLPIQASAGDFIEGHEYEGTIFTAKITAYSEDTVTPEIETPSRALEETKLKEVLAHFRDNDLEVGDTHMKAYKMMGAVAGFGLEVEGGEIELYLFDPATADTETIKSLEDARDTGEFWASAMEIKIPVVINDNILLTGLEYGTFYEHPAKDLIIEIFEEF